MGQPLINEEAVHERECIHRRKGVPGEFYQGDSYVRALQRLRNEAAMKMASKVGAFFWSDAPHVRVWLCRECASEVRLKDQS